MMTWQTLTPPAAWGIGEWTVFGLVLVVALVFVLIGLVKAWSYLRLPFEGLVKGVLTDEKIKKDLEQMMERVAALSVRAHDLAADAHSIATAMTRAEAHMFTAELVTHHDANPAAHNLQMANYPQRRELTNAIERVEEKIESFSRELAEILKGIKDSIDRNNRWQDGHDADRRKHGGGIKE